MLPKYFFVIFAVLLSLLSANNLAQEQGEVSVKQLLETEETVEKRATEELPEEPPVRNTDIVIDPYERGQPQSAMAGFLSAVKDYDYELATHYMDFRNLSDSTAAVEPEELARMLHIVLRRTIWIDLEAISDLPTGNLQDGLPSYRELIGEIDSASGTIRLYLQRVPRSTDRVKIWKISNASVEKIPYLSEQYSYTEFGEWLSKHLPVKDFLGVELWQWVYFSVALVFYLCIAILVTYIASKLIARFKPETHEEYHRFLKGPVTLLLTILMSRLFVAESNVTLAVQAIMDGATILVFAWIWLFVRAIDLVKIKLSDRFIAQDKPLAVYLLRPASTVAKVIIVAVGTLLWFENLGFSATTLLAGLGIGGLAIALAAQKTVENIIGAITLYTSAPVKVGQVCQFGTTFGVVEEIGLRATRVRTINRTVVHVANAQFVDMQLENISEREVIAYRPLLFLKPDCQSKSVEGIIEDIANMLKAHDKIAATPHRVCLKGFTLHGLSLDVLAHVKTTDYDEYLVVINELNLKILDVIAQHGCQLNSTQAVEGVA